MWIDDDEREGDVLELVYYDADWQSYPNMRISESPKGKDDKRVKKLKLKIIASMYVSVKNL